MNLEILLKEITNPFVGKILVKAEFHPDKIFNSPIAQATLTELDGDVGLILDFQDQTSVFIYSNEDFELKSTK